MIQKELGISAPPLPGEHAAVAAEAHPPKIRVIIVDDHAIVRQGLRMFIDLQERDIQVEHVRGLLHDIFPVEVADLHLDDGRVARAVRFAAFRFLDGAKSRTA